MDPNPSFKEVCRALGIGWRELAILCGESPHTMRQRFHYGHSPRVEKADRIIRVLLNRNRLVRALPNATIRNLWKEAA